MVNSMAKAVHLVSILVLYGLLLQCDSRPQPEQKASLKTLESIVSGFPKAEEKDELEETETVQLAATEPLAAEVSTNATKPEEEVVVVNGTIPEEDSRFRTDPAEVLNRAAHFKRQVRAPHMIDFISAGGHSWSQARPALVKRRAYPEDEALYLPTRLHHKRQAPRPVAFPFRLGGFSSSGFTESAPAFFIPSDGINSGNTDFGWVGNDIPAAFFQQNVPNFATQDHFQQQQQPQHFMPPPNQFHIQDQVQFPQARQFNTMPTQFNQPINQFTAQQPMFQPFQQPMQLSQPIKFAQQPMLTNQNTFMSSMPDKSKAFEQSRPVSTESPVQNSTTTPHTSAPEILKPVRPSFLAREATAKSVRAAEDDATVEVDHDEVNTNSQPTPTIE